MAHRDHVTCYLTERDGVWEGLCADLDIAVEGRSLEDTRDRLGQAVRSYLADVMAEAPEHRARLLKRRAPWTVRTSLAARAALQSLRGHGRETRFVMPCPV